MRLKDKIAIITGAASGIGKACAERFAEEGATVVIADINAEKGEQVAQEINGLFVETDVTQPTSVEALIKKTKAEYSRIDILVNNAGIDGLQSPVDTSSLENWRNVLSVNLDGVYYGMKYALAVMKEQKSGVILNMSSSAALNAFENIPSYSAAKAGVIQLSKAAAVEYAAHGIRVNAICPSVVDTPLVRHFISLSPQPEQMLATFENLNPIKGMVTLKAVADATLFLASDEAAYITAIALPVDGGYTAK